MKRLIALMMSTLLFSGALLAADLDQIRRTGAISVAIYNGFAPFSDGREGIEIDIARKLGEKLGVKVVFLPFNADDSVDDDLRNMVWKGTLLGYGPADLMMHVPVEDRFARRNERVTIFAAYGRDNLQITRNLERIPEVRYMEALENEPVGVEGDSLGAAILQSLQRGRGDYDIRHYLDVQQAFADLKAGDLSAVLALDSQTQAAMGEEAGFASAIAPLRRGPPAGWAFGLAVKAENVALAATLEQAMGELEREGQLDEIFLSHGVRRLRPF